MAADQDSLPAWGAIAVAVSAAWGWFSDKSRQIKEDAYNRDLRKSLEAERLRTEAKFATAGQTLSADREHFNEEAAAERKRLEAQAAYVAAARAALESGPAHGRAWLAKFIAEADRAFDDRVTTHLRYKVRPARMAAEEVAAAQRDRRLYKERAKFLEYQLLSLKEYFPFIEEYEADLLDDPAELIEEDSSEVGGDRPDPVLRFLAQADYERLTTAERNQLALDRYLGGNLSKAGVGRLYERYIGYRFEMDGWAVEYHGIKKSKEDLGRDLVCRRAQEVRIIQTKCWSTAKLLHEKHVFQLFGTAHAFRMEQDATDLFAPTVLPVLITSTSLSPIARDSARLLGVEVDEKRPLDKNYPTIKCNINEQSKERIYHLPFDQQYDRTKVSHERGECYVASVAEAEELGFRRAYRYMGPPS